MTEKLYCTECDLCEHGDQTVPLVPGEGDTGARVLILGKAPSLDDQRKLKAFSDDTGRALKKLGLPRVGIDLDDCFLTNVVKHALPKGKKDPYIKEVKACFPLLYEELKAVDPDLIIALGGVPAQVLLGKKKVVDYRGNILKSVNHNLPRQYDVMVTYDPTVFFYNSNNWEVFLSDLRKSKRFLDGTLKETGTNTTVLTSVKDVKCLYEYLENDAEIISWDLESTSLDWTKATTINHAFCFERGESFVVPFYDQDEFIYPPEEEKLVRQLSYELVTGVENKIINWNGPYDYKVMAKEHYRGPQIKVKSVWDKAWKADVMLMHHLLEENIRHKLEFVAAIHTSMPAWNTELLRYKQKHKIDNYRDIPGRILWPYAAGDVDAPFRMYYHFLDRLRDEGLEDFYFEHQHEIRKVLTKMEYLGIPTNVDYLRSLRRKKLIKLDALERKVIDLAGEEFNLKSWQQKGAILFEKLGLPEVGRTPTGGYSTDADSLEKIEDKHPIVRPLIDWNSLKTEISTFLGESDKSIITNTGDDERCRTSFLLHGTVTGRLSSAGPNLTNIPRAGGYREGFQAPKGWKFIRADFSQAELRLSAHESGEDSVLEAFAKGFDGHIDTASAVFGIPHENVTKEQREVGKTVNYLMSYGGGPKRLAEELGISYKEAEKHIQNFYRRRKKLRRWMLGLAKQAFKKGYIRNCFDRVRHFAPVFTDKQKHDTVNKAFNSPCQGGIADALWRAMIKIDRTFEEREMESHLVVPVHDELVGLSPINEVDEAKEIMRQYMEEPLPNGLVIPIDFEISDVWDSKG